MSIEVMTWVGNQKVGSSSEKFVLLIIADHADADGGNAWPSVSRICARTELSRRTVQRCLSKLEEAGWIKIDVQRGGTLDMADSDRPNLYRVVMDERHDDTPGASPRHPGGRHSDTRGGVMVSDRGRHGDAQTIHEPPTEPSACAPPTVNQRAKVITDGFIERFGTYKYIAVNRIVATFLTDGRAEGAIVAALRSLGDQDKPVSLDTVRVEMSGGFQRSPRLVDEPRTSLHDNGLEVLW